VTILETGYYNISFSIHNQGDAQGFDIEINGTPVTTLPFTGDGGGPTTGEIIIPITTVPATLQIVNSDNVAVQLHDNTNATLTVTRISSI
jgi:hypothetical protein